MKAVACLLLIVIVLAAHAQNSIPFTSARWEIKAKDAVQETFAGKACIKITDGSAILKDANFTNGIVEFDMAVVKDRYFPGFGFRMQDPENTEEFYVRPHQSGNPDAMQYYPEYFGGGGWQLYYGDGFNNAHAIPFDRWFHVKFLIKDTMAEVYLDNEAQPALFIKRLYRPVAAGMLALENPWPVPARYANFSYIATNNVTLQNKPKPAQPLPAGVFTSWQISTPFDETELAGKTTLDEVKIPALSWHIFAADERGIADLGMLAAPKNGANTMLAKITMHSDKAEVKKLSFGFSDRVRVFCNGKLLYSGADVFMSRDYRFLGTVGLFDAVYLNLRQGDNEVCFAVSEDFGGWGVCAMIGEP